MMADFPHGTFRHLLAPSCNCTHIPMDKCMTVTSDRWEEVFPGVCLIWLESAHEIDGLLYMSITNPILLLVVL